MNYSTLLFTFFTISTSIFSAPQLIINGYNSDTEDNISFFATDTIAEGETIFFTDRDYIPSSNTFGGNSEGVLQWKTDTQIAAGEVIIIAKKSASKGSITEIEPGFNIANTNDIVWIYAQQPNNQIQILSALATGPVADSIYLQLPIMPQRFALFSKDNGRYIETKLLSSSNIDQFYNPQNWTFTDGSGNQSIELDTSKFVIQAEPAQLTVTEYASTISVQANISPATSKTVLCFDTVPIQNDNIAEWFSAPDSAHSIVFERESPIIELKNLTCGAFYYFKAISFSPQNNALLPSKEHVVSTPANQTMLVRNDSIWKGATDFFSLSNDTVASQKQIGAGSITFSRGRADNFSASAIPCVQHLSNRNNFGIIIASDKQLLQHPNDEYWNGYFLQFGKSSNDSIYFYQRKGIQNILLQSVLFIKKLPWTENLNISIDYLADNSLAVHLQGENADVKTITIQCELPLRQVQYSGVFARSNSIKFTAQFCQLKTKIYTNAYKLTTEGDLGSPTAWSPPRAIPRGSDKLTIENTDSVSISAPYFAVETMNIKNSNLYITNTDTIEPTELSIRTSMTVGPNATLFITNQENSNKPSHIALGDSARLQIMGKIVVDATGTVPNHILSCENGTSVMVKNGGEIVVKKLDGYLFYTEQKHAIQFCPGSQFIQYDGKHPFGPNSDAPSIIFENGSTYRYHGGGISFAGKSYTSLILDTNDTVTFAMGSDTDPASISNFFIKKGKYRFTSHANKKPINLIIDTLTIAENASLSIEPTSQEAFSTVEFSEEHSQLKGNGSLHIGNHASLVCSSKSLSCKLNTVIAGILAFSKTPSRIFADSCTISISGTITGAGAENYIVMPETITDTMCYIERPANKTKSWLFPIGTIKNGYAPVEIKLNTNDSVPFKIRVFTGLYEHGLYGQELTEDTTLGQTWEITPERETSASVAVAWQASAEKPEFFRDYSKIIVNHHKTGNDSWQWINNSSYSSIGNLHWCTADTIRSYSTFSSSGQGSVLGIYFSDFTVTRHSDATRISWHQNISIDSTILYASRNTNQFQHIKTETSKELGKSTILLPSSDLNQYYKIVQYKNGRTVATSKTEFAPIQNEPKKWRITTTKNGASITNPDLEMLKICWVSLTGKIIGEQASCSAQFSTKIPEGYSSAILYIESKNHELTSQLIITQE